MWVRHQESLNFLLDFRHEVEWKSKVQECFNALLQTTKEREILRLKMLGLSQNMLILVKYKYKRSSYCVPVEGKC